MKKDNENRKNKEKNKSKLPKHSDHDFAKNQKVPKTDPSKDSSGNDPHEGPTKTP